MGLIFGRRIDGGMHEDIDITNYGSQKACFNLEIAIRSDFADIFEVKGKKVTRRGAIKSDWSGAAQELTTTYQNGNFSRSLKVMASRQHAAMSYANGRLSFNVELQPGASWHTCLLYTFANGSTDTVTATGMASKNIKRDRQSAMKTRVGRIQATR